jgi:hypothetical protein
MQPKCKPRRQKMKKAMVLIAVFAVAVFGAQNVISVDNVVPVPVNEVTSSTPWDGVGGVEYNVEELTDYDAYEAGKTTYDHQQNGNQGNRCILDASGNIHVSWTRSEEELGDHPNRHIQYNMWDGSAWAYPGGVKASGTNRAGYTTLGVLSDGKAVVAFHETAGSNTYSSVAVEAVAGTGVFNTPVHCDEQPVNADYYPIWPHIVIGADDVIHVTGMGSADGNDGVAYCRSTDGGESFTSWNELVPEYVFGTDVGIAVNNSGSNVAITWVESVAPEVDSFMGGHLFYRESSNSGSSWATKVEVTDYDDNFPMATDVWKKYAKTRGADVMYDNSGNMHIAFEEGYYMHDVDGGYYIYPAWYSRILYWNDVTDDITIASGPYPNITPINEDSSVNEELDTLALWGYDRNALQGGTIYACGDPQLAEWGDYVVLAFGGNRDIEDLSAAGVANGEIYVTVTEDGSDWFSIEDVALDTSMTREEWMPGWVTNITNTNTPGGVPGSCADEGFHTIYPHVGTDNILHLSFQLDLFAGAALSGYPSEGYFTDNPFLYMPQEIKYGSRTINDSNSVVEARPEPVSIELISSNISNGSVAFSINGNGYGSLKVFDATGALVETVHDGNLSGIETVVWDGRNVPAGVYFYSFQTADKVESGRVVLVH